MRLNIVCLIAFVLISIFIQSTAASQCRIIVNNGAAAGAYVEVLDGFDRVFWGPTNSNGTCFPDLVQGRPYTVIVKWDGREKSTNIIANDPVDVSV
jgi:hypothetical protein